MTNMPHDSPRHFHVESAMLCLQLIEPPIPPAVICLILVPLIGLAVEDCGVSRSLSRQASPLAGGDLPRGADVSWLPYAHFILMPPPSSRLD